jgi:hypothetical protein
MLTIRCGIADLKPTAVTQNDALRERRQALRQRPGLTFVHRDEFCELLLSFKKLIRSDEPGMSVRGLLDVESGERYLIEQEELFAGRT